MKCALALLALFLAGFSWSTDIDARLSRAASRCSELADLVACGDALNLNPNDVKLLVAEGDALVRRNRPGEAIGVFRNAMKQSGGTLSIQYKIDAAEGQRRGLLVTCETEDGDAARSACEAAWLPGAPNEATLFRRRGVLLQNVGQLSASLDAFMAAARLRPGDRSTAQAIVSLSERLERDDAQTLSAKGQALIALGRPAAAIVPLRRALKLAPGLAEATAHLKVAEHEQLQKRAVTAQIEAAAAASSTESPLYTNDEPLTRSN